MTPGSAPRLDARDVPHGCVPDVQQEPEGAQNRSYDATHGFSDQYLVELPVFLNCARDAGLQADSRSQARFPSSELATVSLTYFTAG